ncbi:Acyl-CoA N-acyltransferases (NAT) superfamily protein [Abeliophyllum distichum]|uniref:Acyl-CoA N-acyltransferases (NAT) superfamily protein n=1 Tax=Abeliophyllum distichum TaxID=126358 RepID=A0ABD1RAI5_9LAMI
MDASRITLRKFRPTDADDLFSWAGDDRVTRNLRWKTLESKQEALTFIREVCMPHPWRRSICIDDRSVGFISVFPGSGEDRCRAENKASHMVLEKAGLSKEGLLRKYLYLKGRIKDLVVYSILSNDESILYKVEFYCHPFIKISPLFTSAIRVQVVNLTISFFTCHVYA